MSAGVQIAYAEVDGVRVCLPEPGVWCEREHGHDGPHVFTSGGDDRG